MNFIYGPVPSRRLGRSLGIDPIPSKTCNFQCIYCQLGRTTNFTNERQNFYPKDEIIAEIEESINLHEKKIDYITFVGSGEPTLYKDLKDLIVFVKNFSNKPVCVITNGSLMYQKEVSNALMLIDVVLPSLDAGNEELFKKINRPHPTIKYSQIIQGLKNFKKKFKGKLWIEIMLMKGINDSEEALLKIKNQLDLINPDRIDINVPIRPPTEKWVEIPDKNVISLLNAIFGEYNNINFPEIGKFGITSFDFEKELINIIERHPMRQEQIFDTFQSSHLEGEEIKQRLNDLKLQGKIQKIIYNDQIYWKLSNN